MFVQRLISGAVLVVIMAACLIWGGDALWAFCMVAAVIGFYEMTNAIGVLEKEKKFKNELFIAGVLGVVGYYVLLACTVGHPFITLPDEVEASMLCVTVVMLLILVIYVLTYPKYHANQIMATSFSFLYAPVLLSYVYLTRCLDKGIYIVWLIFVSSWICDTAAYCVGVLIGKHKMAPKLSPKKSIEGAIGGLVGAALVGCLYGWILGKMGVMEVSNFVAYPIIATAGGFISMIGDLAASAVKRNYDIKDYGHLIPGHGGILDRFDSVIFTAPIIYYLSVFILK